jgi:hypothetical protein
MKHLCAACALFVASIGIVHFAQAQGTQPARGQSEAAQAAAESSEEKPLSFEGKVTFPTAYVFRGYVIEDSNFMVQPEAQVNYTMQCGDLTITPHIGAWANLTDLPAPGDPEWFNEIDAILGVDIELPKGFSLGLVYTWYNSPANFFNDVHEVGLTLDHDDFLHPNFGIYYELDDDNGREDTYVEFGITPGFDVPQIKPLHLDFPMLVGLTPDKYYTDDDGDGTVFGYCSFGIEGVYSLGDHWGLFAGVDYVQLLADSTEASNRGDDHQWVGKAGVQFSF